MTGEGAEVRRALGAWLTVRRHEHEAETHDEEEREEKERGGDDSGDGGRDGDRRRDVRQLRPVGKGERRGRAGGERARRVDDVWGGKRCAPRGVVVRAAHLSERRPSSHRGRRKTATSATREVHRSVRTPRFMVEKRAREMRMRTARPTAWIAPNTTTTTSCADFNETAGCDQELGRELATPQNNRRGYDELPRKTPGGSGVERGSALGFGRERGGANPRLVCA